MLIRTCECCGAEFEVALFQTFRGHRFCSELCRKRAEGRRYRARRRAGNAE